MHERMIVEFEGIEPDKWSDRVHCRGHLQYLSSYRDRGEVG